jgi:uncharacterized membrane protein
MALPDNWQVRLIQLLAVPGMMVAYYLYLFHSGSLFTTCTVNDLFDCGQVSGPGAPYSSIGPIPVALIGLFGFAVIFLVVWLQDWIELVEDYLPELVIGIVGLAFLFTLGLTALEFFVIHAFCQYCLYSAAIVIVMLILAISYLLSGRKISDR